MALEIHILPISAFIVGDYDPVAPGVEAGPRGVHERRSRPRWFRWLRQWQRGDGLLYVEWLREQLGDCPRWNEEGDTMLSLEVPAAALHALRAAAYRIEFPTELGSIEAIAELYAKKDERRLQPRQFAHLCDHSDFQGFYLPFDFEAPRWIPDPRWADHPWFKDKPEMQKTSVGSAVELRQELEELKGRVSGDALAGWELMSRLAQASCDSNTPMCLDG